MALHTEFAKSLLIKAGLPNDENLDILVDDVLNTFYEWQMTQYMKRLNKEQLDRLGMLVKNDSDEKEIFSFFQNNIDDFDNVMESMYSEFEKLYLDKVQEHMKGNLK